MTLQRKALADKIMILGVDGMDPKLTNKFLKEGLLPNVQKFIEKGSIKEELVMQGVHPTVTPLIGTTMATGACSGIHESV